MKKQNEQKNLLGFVKIQNGERLNNLYSKSDVILLGDFFQKFIKVLFKEFGIISV